MSYNFLAEADPPGCGAMFTEPFGIVMIVIFGVLILGFFLMPLIRRRGKNQSDDLHANLEVGDKVMTVCGIIGTVTAVNINSSGEKEVEITTGNESCQSSIIVHISGIYKNFTKPPVPRDFFGRPKKGYENHAAADSNAVSHDLEMPAGGDAVDASSEPFANDTVVEVEASVGGTQAVEVAAQQVPAVEAAPIEAVAVVEQNLAPAKVDKPNNNKQGSKNKGKSSNKPAAAVKKEEPKSDEWF